MIQKTPRHLQEHGIVALIGEDLDAGGNTRALNGILEGFPSGRLYLKNRLVSVERTES